MHVQADQISATRPPSALPRFSPRARWQRARRWRWLGVAVGTLSLDCRPLTAEPGAAAPARPAPAVAPARAVQVAEAIYDAGLGAGWQDWGWGPHQLSSGPARINLSQYGGWILHHDTLSARFGGFAFRMLAPGSFGAFLQVQLGNGDDKSLPVVDVGAEHSRALPGGWLEILIPWSQLNPTFAPFDRVILHAKSSVAADWVQFDQLALTRFDPAVAASAAGAAPSRRVSLSVSCRAPGHAISPYIYGVAGEVSGDLPATARRWGGNPTSRYNWQTDAINSAKDWYFENGKSGGYGAFLDSNRAHHAASALTVPIIGWVAKDTTSVGFPVSSYGPQRGCDPNRRDAGDGIRPDGVPIRPSSPAATSVPAPPEMIQRWVETIRKQQDEKSPSRSVKLYFLDNEPNLWSSTHRDIHPEPLSYDELLDRSIRYGTAIRTADSQALIAGPAEWGWTGYFYSAQDAFIGVGSRPDRRAHGDIPLIPWYLKKLQEHDKTSGKRVLDVLDVHYYPQANGVYGPAADPASAALRLRSTRSLWDPSYTDESWINDTVRLLPRLKEWVAQNYPGLGISIGEYNFGGEQHISGGLALAEALGRFGVAGIDYAFYWFLPPKNSPAYWAFRAYRDFDGKGGQFLGHSLDTRMDPSVSLFASRDDSGKHLVLIALNLDPNKAAQASIDLAGCSPIATRRSFSYGAGSASLADEGSKSVGSLDETLAPYSINVFDVRLK